MAKQSLPPPEEAQETPDLINSELIRLFKLFDTNGDGKVSPEELTSCLKSLGTKPSHEQDFERIFKHFDRNNDGIISKEEAASLLDCVGVNRSRSVEFDELYALLQNGDDNYNDLKEAFDMYEDNDKDDNNNHQFSILKSLRENIPLDLDCKGVISTLWKTFIWQVATTIVRKLADKAAGRFLQWFRL